MILSSDIQLFLYAANPDSPHHDDARRFFEAETVGRERFHLCGLVLVGLDGLPRRTVATGLAAISTVRFFRREWVTLLRTVVLSVVSYSRPSTRARSSLPIDRRFKDDIL